MSIKLYGYWRSSATYRVRIALNLKQVAYNYVPVHLVKNGGGQHLTEYQTLNPAELVPTLIDNNGNVLNQSSAIIEYLDELYPQAPMLLPSTPLEKAKVRTLAQDIACDIQPLANLRVMQYLNSAFDCSDAQQKAWSRHWIETGFVGIEKRLKESAGDYCFGNDVSMADLYLVPQVYNAIRFSVNLDNYPLIHNIYLHCNQLAAFTAAKPENQPDAE
jgi:maleylacetoacetate isomerase